MKVRRKSDAEVLGTVVDRVVGVLVERTDRDEVTWEGEGLGPYFLGIGEWEIWLRTETPEERSFLLRLERGGEACEVEVVDRGVLWRVVKAHVVRQRMEGAGNRGLLEKFLGEIEEGK